MFSFVQILFREERLPLEEGWKPSETPIDDDTLDGVLEAIEDATNWAPSGEVICPWIRLQPEGDVTIVQGWVTVFMSHESLCENSASSTVVSRTIYWIMCIRRYWLNHNVWPTIAKYRARSRKDDSHNSKARGPIGASLELSREGRANGNDSTDERKLGQMYPRVLGRRTQIVEMNYSFVFFLFCFPFCSFTHASFNVFPVSWVT